MITKKPLFGLAAASALACTLGAANAQNRLAFSEANGIEVLTLLENWCAERFELEFRLTAGSPLRDRAQLAAFAPRLAPIFEAECPAGTEAQVRVRGQDGSQIPGNPAYRMFREAGWALQSVPPDTAPEGPAMSVASAAPAASMPAQSAPATGALTEAVSPSTGEAPPPPPAGPSVDQLVRAASPMGNEDYLSAVFHFQPQFADLSRFPNSALTLGALFNCPLQRQAGSDEFARRQLDAAMEAQAQQISANASAVTGRNFILSITAQLGEYSFERSAFPFQPLSGSWRLPGYRTDQNCWTTARGSVPTSFTLQFDPATAITEISMSESEAQRLRARMRNSRNLDVEIVFNITGVDVRSSTAELTAEPVAVRVLMPGNRAAVAEFDRATLRSNIERARRAAEEAERQRREAERLARVERLAFQRDIQIEQLQAERDFRLDRLRDRIASTESPARRIFMVHGPSVSGSVYDRHPSALAARHREDEEHRIGLVLFQAGNTRGDYTEAAWPSALRVRMRGEDSDTTLQRDGWYVAVGPVGLDTERMEGRREGGLRAALIEVDWVFACHSVACEAEASSRDLLDLARDSVDRQISEQIAALQAEYDQLSSQINAEASAN